MRKAAAQQRVNGSPGRPGDPPAPEDRVPTIETTDTIAGYDVGPAAPRATDSGAREPNTAEPDAAGTGTAEPDAAGTAGSDAAGTAGSAAGGGPPGSGPRPGRVDRIREVLRGRSEVFVAGLLAVLGGFVIVDALRTPTDFVQRGPVGPKALPTVVGIGLLVVAVLLAIDVLRGGHGEPEMGEDVELTGTSDWRTLVLLAGALLANLALIDTAGWPVSGAVLFWGAAYALGSRHYLRDPLIALVLSVGSYLGLVQLGVVLPGGVLEGVLTWTP